MVVELEVGVVDPYRVVQSERHPEGPLPELRYLMQSLLDDTADLRVAGRG